MSPAAVMCKAADVIGSDPLSVVLEAVAAAAATGTGSVVDAVCTASTRLLSLRGAGLSLMVDGELRGAAGGTEPGVAAIQELQLSLGEGPCVEAWETGRPVLEPDLADPDRGRWPIFAQAVVQRGVRAVFALPLRLGAIRPGVLALYRDRAGSLSESELAYGMTLADVCAQVVLGLQAGARPDSVHAALAQEPTHWAEIHQATGVVSVQLGVSLDEAFVRLRAHAFAAGRSLRETASDVVAGRLYLEGGS